MNETYVLGNSQLITRAGQVAINLNPHTTPCDYDAPHSLDLSALDG
jgi:hypothetical protein